MPSLPRRARTAGALAAAAVLLVACGGDDGTRDATTAATTAVTTTTAATTAAPTTTAAPQTTFPVTVEHAFGSTTIDAEPQRVVSVGYRDQDFVLAFDVVPVGIRDWYGDQPSAVWPWAQDRLGGAAPTVMDAAEINFEAVAALEPDLIMGVTAGMSEQDYALLDQIAPTIAHPADVGDFGVSWQQTTEIIGAALGRSDQAAEIIAGIEARYEATRAAHPEFAGATAAVAFTRDGLPGAYNSHQARTQLLADLGLVTPPQFDELAGQEFFFTVSEEELPVLETDVLVWITPNATSVDSILALSLRPSLRAYAEGREVLTTVELAGAFAFTSPLSIQYVLDHLVPDLTAALDGDPATPVSDAAILYPA